MQLTGGRQPERVVAEYKRRFDSHDLNGLLALRASNCATVDHRRAGMAREVGEPEGWRPEFASADVRVELVELLACDERVIAMRAAVKGTTPGGGGEFELVFGAVDVVEDELLVRVELYDPDEQGAMLARYRELGGRLA